MAFAAPGQHPGTSGIALADILVGSRGPADIAAAPRPVLVRKLGTFWRAQTAGWFFIVLFGIASRVVAFGDLQLALLLTVVLEPVGFGLTASAHYVFHQRIGPRLTLKVVVIAVALSVLGGVLQAFMATAIKEAFLAGSEISDMTGSTAVPAVYYSAVFLGWALAYLWIKAEADVRSERVRRSEAQEAALHAELHQLRLQLDPHFLFNALNTVAVEIPERPGTALEMTHRIAAYLRYSLDNHSRRLCTLADEIEAVRAYMRIQELRFEGRLECKVDSEPAADTTPVPHLIIQTLVENAVKHGLQSPVQRFTVHVTVRQQDETLAITVSNPGRLAMQERDRPAVGLANLRRRLELHYPLGHDLTLTQHGDRVVAQLIARGAACFA
jgi:two-component system LytT family sensor kinase